ncbi:hypothetical protein COO60DRAFT_335180 [Scenedesmus sp. NREL 46B-D3]|nr:hypothetical protein COO60DRAFT_335180 [Scenedesmus sp. NREL 46B-D3]
MEENSADQQKRPPVLQRAKRSSNRWMRRKGWSLHNRQLVFHYAQLVWEQVSAMLPITLLQVLVLAIFFNKSSSTPGIDAAGLLSAVVGLVLFLEGLRVAIMPMALLVGNQLPVKLKLPWVLLVAFCLGVVSGALAATSAGMAPTVLVTADKQLSGKLKLPWVLLRGLLLGSGKCSSRGCDGTVQMCADTS